MADGYVTQSRMSPTQDMTWAFRRQPPGPNQSYSLLQEGDALLNGAKIVGNAPVQTTTSYRTGRADEAQSQADDDVYDSVESRAKFLSRSRSEYRRDAYDNGHTFNSTRQGVSLFHNNDSQVYWENDSVNKEFPEKFKYIGPLYPSFFGNPRGSGYPQLPAVNLATYGTAAISRTRPTASAVSLSTAIAELKREGFPSPPGYNFVHMRDMTRELRKKSGSEYLNYEFGWKPIVRDVMKFMTAVAASKTIIEQYKRDSGRIVRRTHRFPSQTETTAYPPFLGYITSVPGSHNNTAFSNMFAKTSGPATEILKSTTQIWFSGAYTYYVDLADDALSRLTRYEQLANKLFGTRITPETLWNLAPWSWLLDWHANIGQIIGNATAFQSDSLVLKYGYLMCQQEATRTVLVDGVTMKIGGGVGTLGVKLSSARKQRLRASPYGFGSPPSSFTTRQWAILAALGMTKAPTTLR